MRRIAITGSSGFYGRAVIRAIRDQHPDAVILGLDLAEPNDSSPDQFVRCDVLSPELRQQLTDFNPDTLIHLAFVVNPIRDEDRMHEINVGGMRNVLSAAAEIQPKRLLVSSSATAYGAWEDNPVPMKEEHPLRSRTEYRYADDKVQVEQLLQDFTSQHANIAVSWTRPCMIYGPGLSNYLTDFILKGPLIILPAGNDTELQFIHLDDVAAATLAILNADARGPFNLAPDDWFTLRDLARLTGRSCMSVPMKVILTISHLWRVLRLPVFHFPCGLWYFIRYPWVVAPARLENELNFRCRLGSHQVLEMLLSDAGKLKKPSIVADPAYKG